MMLDACDTPVVEVDLAAVKRNIQRMQAYCDAHKIGLLAHSKTHKLPQIAHLQLAAGAKAIVCQKLGEAELMVRAGVKEILIPYPIVGDCKVRRLTALAREAQVTVAVDSAVIALGLSRALQKERVSIGALVDCDTGFGRTGVQTVHDAVRLAELIAEAAGLRLEGLLTHPTPTDCGFLASARSAIEGRGLPVRRVSGGGTPMAFETHTHPELSELRVGTYVYGDRRCIANGTVPLGDCALRIRTTVVSRPTPDRAILDAGSKTLTNDRPDGIVGYGLVVEYPDAAVTHLSEEHAHVQMERPSVSPEVGEVVTVIPNHACGTVNLHDAVLVRHGGTSEVWPVVCRGKVR